MMEALPVPINRAELYLAKIAGEDVTIPDMPINNTEVFLARLAGADIVLPTPINTLQVWLAILCGEQYSTPPVQGAELIGVQMVRTEFLAASAGLDGVTTPTPENRAEEYWAKIAEEMAVQTITVKGTSLHLLHVVSGIEDLQYVYGDTEQTKYSGKNLFNNSLSPASTTGATAETIASGVRCVATTNGASTFCSFRLFKSSDFLGKTITLSAKTSPSASNKASSYIGLCDENGGNRQAKVWGNPDSSGNIMATYTHTTESDTRPYIMVALYSNSGGTAQVGDYMDYTDLQLELGSTATSYEPYVGGTASPNPDYPQDIHVVTGEQTVTVTGKNLFNKNGPLTNGYLRNNGTISGSAWRITDYIAIRPNTEYTTSGMTSGIGVNPSRCYYDKDKNFISGVAHGNTVNTYFTNTSPANAYYMRDSLQTADLDTIQIEEGSATSYEPYQSQFYTVDLGSTELCKIGDYQDYIYKSGDDWYVHKEVAKYTFTGSEFWTADPYGTNSWRTSGMIIVYDPDTAKTMAICDVALGVPYDKRTSYDSPRTCICYYNVSSNRFWVRNTACDTLEKIQTATTGKNVYYKVAPTDTKITDATLVSQLNALDSATLPTPEAFVTVSGNLPAPIQFTYQGKL